MSRLRISAVGVAAGCVLLGVGSWSGCGKSTPAPATSSGPMRQIEGTAAGKAVAQKSPAKIPDVQLMRVSYDVAPPQSEGTVDPHRGSLFLTATDLVVPAGAVELRLERCLQSSPRFSGLLENRWRLNWECALIHEGTSIVLEEWLGPIEFPVVPGANRLRSSGGEELLVHQEGGITRTKPDGTREEFDSRGRLASRVLANGNTFKLEYDSSGRLSRVTGPYGSFLQLTTNQDGLLVRVESSTGVKLHFGFGEAPWTDEQTKDRDVIEYAYNSQGALTEIKTPHCGSTIFTYDRESRIRSRLSANRELTEFEFHAEGDVMRRTDAAGRIHTTKWSSDRRTSRTTDAAGQTSTVEYNPAGQPLKITGPTGQSTSVSYDEFGRAIQIDNPVTGATRFEYSRDNSLLTRLTAPASKSQLYEYDERRNLINIVQEGRDCPIASYVYLPDGVLKSSQSCGGVLTEFSYDPQGRKTKVQDADGRTWQYEYDQRGNIQREIDPLGAITVRKYDSRGRLVSLTEPTGGTWRYEYGADGLIASLTDPLGMASRFEHDAVGRVSAITDQVGRKVSYEFEPDGQLKSSAKGRISVRFEYDAQGNLHRTINSAGAATTRTHDALGHLTSLAGPSGSTIRYDYSSDGRFVSTTDARGLVTRYEYDEVGRIAKETRGGRPPIRYEYNPDGDLAKVIPAIGPPQSYLYDDHRRLVAVSEGDLNLVRYDYDQRGRRTRSRHVTGLEVTYQFNALGKVVKQSDNLGESESTEYDLGGRITAISDSTGATVRNRYDLAGRLLDTTNPLGQARRFQYTPVGEVSQVIDPNGDVAKYRYDDSGQLSEVEHPAGGQTRFGYNALGKVTSVVDPLGQQSTSTFDDAGRLTAVTDANKQTISVAYDTADRVLQKQLPDGTVVTYQYDASGNLVEVSDGVFPIRYAYDEHARLVQVEYPAIKRKLRYEYNELGLRSRFTDADGEPQEYEYDSAKRLTAISLPGKAQLRLAYDAKNRLTSIAYPNGVQGTWEYDPANRVTQLKYSDRQGKVTKGWQYSYDAAGNRSKTVSLQGEATDYEYDPAGQLIKESQAGGNAVRYQYLPGGNRGQVERAGAASKSEYDQADRLLKNADGQFQWDANGNLIERRIGEQITRYHWNALDQLVKVEFPEGDQVAFGYAPTGEQVWREDTAGRVYFLYDGPNLIAELDSQLKPQVKYFNGPSIDHSLAVSVAGKRYFLHSDVLGSVVGMTDEQSQLVVEFDYDAFGNRTKRQGNIEVATGFTGRRWDARLGLYYYRARFYDPTLGRFINRDPVGGRVGEPLTLNPYIYVLNNPLRFTDPYGTAPTGLPGQPNGPPLPKSSFFPDFNTKGKFDPIDLIEVEQTIMAADKNAIPTSKVLRVAVYEHERIHWEQFQDFMDSKHPGWRTDPAMSPAAQSQLWSNHYLKNGYTLERQAYARELEVLLAHGLPPNHPDVKSARNMLDSFTKLEADAFAAGKVPGRASKFPEGWDETTAKSQRRPDSDWDGPVGAGDKGRVTEFLEKHGGKISIAISAAEIASCMNLGLSASECAQKLAIDSAIGAGVTFVAGPQGIVILTAAGAVIGVINIAEGVIEVRQDWLDWKNRQALEQDRIKQAERNLARLDSDIGLLDRFIAALAQVRDKIPEASAVVAPSAKPGLDAAGRAQAALAPITAIQADAAVAAKACAAATQAKDRVGPHALKAEEEEQLVTLALDEADFKADKVQSEEEALAVLALYDAAKAKVDLVSRHAADALDKNNKLDEVLLETLAKCDLARKAIAGAPDLAKVVTAEADAASAAVEPTRGKVQTVRDLIEQVEKGGKSVAASLAKLRQSYHEIAKEHPEVEQKYAALANRLEAATRLPPSNHEELLSNLSKRALEARAHDTDAQKLVQALSELELCQDLDSADAMVARADAAKARSQARLASSANVPRKLAAWLKVEVPGVRGLAAAEARYEIQRAKLAARFELTQEKPASKELEFTVLAQEPATGAKAKPGDVVVLQIYPAFAPSPLLKVPALTGLTKAAAIGIVKDAGFTKPAAVVDSGEPTPPGKENTVATQSPDPNEEVAPDKLVVIYVYPATNEVSVPPLVGLTADAATTKLRQSGLDVGNIEEIDAPNQKVSRTVKMQVPAAGAMIAKGSTVALNVYREYSPPTTTETPNTPIETGRKTYVVTESNYTVTLGGEESTGKKVNPGYLIGWEIKNDSIAAEAWLVVPPNAQADVRRELGYDREIPLKATWSTNGEYVLDVQQLLARCEAAIARAGAEGIKVQDTPPLRLVNPRLAGQVRTEGTNLRLRFQGGFSIGDIPLTFQADLIAKPKP